MWKKEFGIHQTVRDQKTMIHNVGKQAVSWVFLVSGLQNAERSLTIFTKKSTSFELLKNTVH